MLGDLQYDMNRQGVNVKQKGVCAACQKPIAGQVLSFIALYYSALIFFFKPPTRQCFRVRHINIIIIIIIICFLCVVKKSAAGLMGQSWFKCRS